MALSCSPHWAHRWLTRSICLASGLAALAFGIDAHAYEVRETTSHLPVHWRSSQVVFELDPSVSAAVPGAASAAVAAALAWSGKEGAPQISLTVGTPTGTPAVDTRNIIYFAPDGYPGAGDALAVTFVSYDDTTGEIVDTDIVINGKYTFAVLPATDRASAGALEVVNEPTSDPASVNLTALGTGPASSSGSSPSAPFDLVHVLVHETGHALGLLDVEATPTDAMYLYSSAGDASRRSATSDDLAGIDFLYSGANAEPQGCWVGHGERSSGSGSLVGFTLAVGAWVGQRRRYARRQRASR